MTTPIDLPLDDDDRLTAPPLIDSLHYERDADAFSILFVPSAGDEPTRHVLVLRDSTEGRQIAAYLYRIQQLIGAGVERLVHRGGGDYSLRLVTGRTLSLADQRNHESWAPEVFDRLKQIGQVAEIAFELVNASRG